MRNIRKKGQGMPLNTIIIAIIVLVVLVVLVAIFTGRISLFEKDVTKQSRTELVALRVTYGTCHPDASAEQNFVSQLANAKSNNDPAQEAAAKTELQQKVAVCNAKLSAECSGGCTTTAAS